MGGSPWLPTSFHTLTSDERQEAKVCMRVCVHTRPCQHLHTPLPTTAEEQKRGRASFQNQSTWKNGCGSTKPGLNQQWADCLATVTNDLMWRRRDRMCAEQGPPGACTCQTTGCLGGRWLPRVRAQHVAQ